LSWQEHLAEQRARYRANRTHQRPDYRIKKWRELRERVLARDGRCVACGSVEDLRVDHILSLARGGTNTEGNMQALCARCNAIKGATVDKQSWEERRDA
jgi:5-methylcytosine-specific restriction endonuclease McrA